MIVAEELHENFLLIKGVEVNVFEFIQRFIEFNALEEVGFFSEIELN